MLARGFYAGLVVTCLGGCLDPFPGGPQMPADGADGGGIADMTTQSGSGIDPAAQHCVDVLNLYRSQAGVAAIKYDARLSMFSTSASQALAAGGGAHQYFIDASHAGTLFSSGFCGGAAENQAPGWAIQPDENGTIDSVLAAMMAEGPGGGHHDAIVNPSYGIVGVGLVIQNGGLWFTNDFSPPCH